MLSYKKQVQVFIKMLYYVPWKDFSWNQDIIFSNRQLYISFFIRNIKSHRDMTKEFYNILL